MEPAHATTKASRSRCMDVIHIWNLLMLATLWISIHKNLLMLKAWMVIHIWNLLMLQLKHQEVVAWM